MATFRRLFLPTYRFIAFSSNRDLANQNADGNLEIFVYDPVALTFTQVTNSRMINSLPTISRSITDFTRLTPQANGNSFAGRDGRYNNVTIDGANLNNNFGLSTDPLPGGGSNPVSLDAIEEISVNIAPYDVRQANFTGANISAVTKSGTNTFKGIAYAYYRNQSFNGLKVGEV